MLSIAVANHKGGVGKTATTHALAVALAERGRVLMVDADPHSSLTGAAGVDTSNGPTLADVMRRRSIASQAVRQLSDTLAILPASLDLATVELELAGKMGREFILQKQIAPLADAFSICLIDCPPSLSLMTVNALVCAAGVIVPTQPTAQDMRALASFLATVAEAQEINTALEIIGILPTFYDARLTHHAEALEAMRGAGWPVLSFGVPRSVRVAEAAAQGESVLTYAPDAPAAQAYAQLAGEVLRWQRGKTGKRR